MSYSASCGPKWKWDYDYEGLSTSDSDTSYDEIRIGGGIDIPFSDRGFARVGVAS